jgi:hypothetical protein
MSSPRFNFVKQFIGKALCPARYAIFAHMPWGRKPVLKASAPDYTAKLELDDYNFSENLFAEA